MHPWRSDTLLIVAERRRRRHIRTERWLQRCRLAQQSLPRESGSGSFGGPRRSKRRLCRRAASGRWRQTRRRDREWVPYWLVTSFFTVALELVGRFDTGAVGVNQPTTGVDIDTPFGGRESLVVRPARRGKAASDIYTSVHAIGIYRHWPPAETADQRGLEQQAYADRSLADATRQTVHLIQRAHVQAPGDSTASQSADAPWPSRGITGKRRVHRSPRSRAGSACTRHCQGLPVRPNGREGAGGQGPLSGCLPGLRRGDQRAQREG